MATNLVMALYRLPTLSGSPCFTAAEDDKSAPVTLCASASALLEVVEFLHPEAKETGLYSAGQQNPTAPSETS
jgi:hypothetical protein